MSSLVERLQQFNRNRDPHLVKLKYELMKGDIFAFYRGTCHLFYQDWPVQSLLNDAPSVFICGDLHWQNLGSYKGDNRLVYFGLNDFDEAALAPFTWDIARSLVGFLISPQVLNVKEALLLRLCQYALEVYTKALDKSVVRFVEEANTNGIVHDLLFQVRKRSRKSLLDARTIATPAGRRLRIDNQRYFAATEAEHVAVRGLLDEWSQTQHNPAFYQVLDMAHRIAGVGSLGVERYIILVQGKGSPDQNYLLDLKAEPVSSLQPYLQVAQPHWNNEAERVVMTQRQVQGIAPALLTPLQLNERWFVLRELQPTQDKVNADLLCGNRDGLEKFIKTIMRVIAWGQLRSGGRHGAASAEELLAYVHSSHWSEAMLEYARSYARIVHTDYEEFCASYQELVH